MGENEMKWSSVYTMYADLKKDYDILKEKYGKLKYKENKMLELEQEVKILRRENKALKSKLKKPVRELMHLVGIEELTNAWIDDMK